MGKVNVYLPDELERQVRDAGLAVSPLCQMALHEAVARLRQLGAAASVDELRNHEGRGRMTPRLAEVLEAAEGDAAGRGRQVGVLDLIGAVLDHGENLGARALAAAGLELPPAGFLRRRRGVPAPAKGRGELSAEARELLAAAFRVALDLRHGYLGTEHLVIAAAAEGSPAAPMFAALGIDDRVLRGHVERLIDNPWATTATPPEPAADAERWARLEAQVQRLAAEIDRLKATPPSA